MNRLNKADLNVQQNEGHIDIIGFLKKLLRNWWFFLITGIICLTIAFFYIKSLTPKYFVAAKILVEDHVKGGSVVNPGAILGDMSNLLDQKSNVDNEVEILRTKYMAQKVVEKLGLNITYFESKPFKDVPLYWQPFKIEILEPAKAIYYTKFNISFPDNKTINLSYKNSLGTKVEKSVVFNQPFLVEEVGLIKIASIEYEPYSNEKYAAIVSSIDEAVEIFRSELSIGITNKLVSSIDIGYQTAMPEQGEQILNALIQEYILKNVDDKNQIADSTISFIENRLMLVSRELGDIEGNILNFKQSNNLADISEQSKMLISNTNTYNKEIASLKTHIDIIESLQGYISDKKNLRVVPHSVMPEDVVFNKLVENYNTLLQQKDNLLLTSTDGNPYVKNLDNQILELRNAMLSNLEATKRTIKIKLSQLQATIDDLSGSIRNVPAHEKTYLQMFRQQTLKQELYLFLLKKREETALSKTSNISSAKVIDPPSAFLKPISPNKILIYVVGLLIGLGIPFLVIYAQDLFYDRVKDRNEVSRAVSVPIIGEIGYLKLAKGLKPENPDSIIAEQYRDLRTNIDDVLVQDNGNCILITSSMEGEGKTMTAINLSAVLAFSGKKVLIIDMDLRLSKLSNALALSSKPGLTHYFNSGNGQISNHIYPSEIHPNLSVLPSGIIQYPTEFLMSKELGGLLAELKSVYDYVVITCPPIGLFTDAKLLQKYASLTLYVIRENYTPKKHLLIIENLRSNNKNQNMYLVLNEVKNNNKKKMYGKYAKAMS